MSADFCRLQKTRRNQNAIELNPKYARTYVMRGRAYAALGDNDHAKADRDKALELEPEIE
ncbi:MAG: tetratricopeptide repeat protein [Planctomycetaceae bacterium]